MWLVEITSRGGQYISLVPSRDNIALINYACQFW